MEVSSRLTSSPSALVQPQWGLSPQMQRFMKQQAAAGGADAMAGMAANLEINPTHPVVLKLKGMAEANSSGARQYAQLLYDVAVVSSGLRELKSRTIPAAPHCCCAHVLLFSSACATWHFAHFL